MKASPPPLSQQVIIITGASSGFGRGAALAFAAKGASVVLVARRGALLEALAVECKANGGDALAFPVDVSRREETKKVMNAAVERFGRIDTWINNAGVGAIGQFEDVPIIDHEQVLRTNLFGTLYGSYAAMQNFRVNGS